MALVDLPEQNDPGYPTATLPGIAPFSTAKLLVLDGGRWNEVRDLGEVSMGRPDVLAAFIEEAADRFPADKYGLMLSTTAAAARRLLRHRRRPAPRTSTSPTCAAGMLAGMQAAGIDRFELHRPRRLPDGQLRDGLGAGAADRVHGRPRRRSRSAPRP